MGECDFCDIFEEWKKNKLDPLDKRRWITEGDGWFSILALEFLSEGHTLVILKKHRKDVTYLEEQDLKCLLEALIKVPKAMKNALTEVDKVYVASFCENGISPTEHMHFHLIPRYKGSENKGYNIFCQRERKLIEISPQQISRISTKIRKELEKIEIAP